MYKEQVARGWYYNIDQMVLNFGGLAPENSIDKVVFASVEIQQKVDSLDS